MSGTETKHTAGPWEIGDTTEGDVNVWAGENENVFIAAVGGEDLENDQQVANAMLIAASPELLSACERARTIFATMQGMPPSVELIEEMRDLLESAVAKANGGAA